jgi:hypothetical protein
LNAKTISIFVAGLIVAGAVSGVLVLGYQAQIVLLKSELGQLQTEYDALQESYTQKTAEYNNLNSLYLSVQSERNTLQSSLASLQSDLDTKRGYMKQVSTDLLSLYDTLNTYSNLEDSFPRVLSSDELDKIGSTVTELTNPSKDPWYNYQKLWDYVDDNIDYVYDIEFPYISKYSYITIDDVQCLTDFTVETRTNYNQLPEFTLEYKQGDCDDQAILLYGMMRYYLRNVYGTVYNTYLAFISFTDGEAHLAVFMPVQGGTMCILDPAGNYATERYGSLTSKTPSIELQSYADHWSSEHTIESIKLYWVNDLDGSFSVEFDGNLDEAADFFLGS